MHQEEEVQEPLCVPHRWGKILQEDFAVWIATRRLCDKEGWKPVRVHVIMFESHAYEVIFSRRGVSSLSSGTHAQRDTTGWDHRLSKLDPCVVVCVAPTILCESFQLCLWHKQNQVFLSKTQSVSHPSPRWFVLKPTRLSSKTWSRMKAEMWKFNKHIFSLKQQQQGDNVCKNVQRQQLWQRAGRTETLDNQSKFKHSRESVTTEYSCVGDG